MSIISEATGKFCQTAALDKLLEQESRVEAELRRERVLVNQDSLRVQLAMVREEISRRQSSSSTRTRGREEGRRTATG